MKEIGIWCKLVATVSVITSVISLILPEGKQKKTFSTLVGIILVFTLVSPLTDKESISFDFDDDFFGSNEDNFQISAYDYKNYPLAYAAERETEKYITEYLKSMGVECSCIVNCAIEDDMIIIEEVNINYDVSLIKSDILTDFIRKTANEETVIILNGERYE